jgi:hypothetical protein
VESAQYAALDRSRGLRDPMPFASNRGGFDDLLFCFDPVPLPGHRGG